VAAWDSAGLERLFRYCGRPIFAGERLQWIEKDQLLVYRLPKPRPNGQTVLTLTPLEFLDTLAVLVPSHACIAIGIMAFWPQMSRSGLAQIGDGLPEGGRVAGWRYRHPAP